MDDESAAALQPIWAAMHHEGLSFNRLGHLSGICPETIRSWHSGKASPSIAFLLPVLRALGLTLKMTKE